MRRFVTVLVPLLHPDPDPDPDPSPSPSPSPSPTPLALTLSTTRRGSTTCGRSRRPPLACAPRASCCRARSCRYGWAAPHSWTDARAATVFIMLQLRACSILCSIAFLLHICVFAQSHFDVCTLELHHGSGALQAVSRSQRLELLSARRAGHLERAHRPGHVSMAEARASVPCLPRARTHVPHARPRVVGGPTVFAENQGFPFNFPPNLVARWQSQGSLAA